MYRGVTLFAIENELISDNKIEIQRLISKLEEINLTFEINPTSKSPELCLNGINVEHEIRSPRIASLVSQIAKIKEVREKLVQEQREMGKNGGIVMDGRDIGSVVFPNADLKLFVTANIDIRTERRYLELKSKGINSSMDEVGSNLTERDYIDSTRKESPLIQTNDAIVIDNSFLSKTDQLNIALDLVTKKNKELV